MSPRHRPDHDAALAQYRRRAAVYDFELLPFEGARVRAVQALALQRGQTVLDLACGTGLSFELLHEAVGAAGRIVGVEQSPEMLERARERVRRHRWRNVDLIEAPVESAPIEGQADAALFHFTHDVLRAPSAVAKVLKHLRPGARVVACGLQWAPTGSPMNLFVWGAALHSVSQLEGLARPWSLLEDQLEQVERRSLFLGAVYLLQGTLRVH